MNKTLSIDNQQGSRRVYNELCATIDPSETTRRAPFSKKVIEAYFLGAIHDGTFSSNKRFRISQKGTEWLEVLQKCFAYLGYKSWIYKEGKDREVYVLETLANFLDFNFNPLRLKKNSEKAGYIRGFFDAEGGIPKNSKAKFYIQLAQKNEKKMRDIKNILTDLKIKTGKIHNPSQKVDPNYWRIYVSAESQKAFVEKISSWHPRKIRTLVERVKI
jgi:intein-encoded DNA endonuclease-like protein